jgi:hexokinase
MDDRSETGRFLDRHGMRAIRFDGLVADLLSEMEEGLAGRTSSLAMIPTWLAPVERIPAGEPVLAIDAGGTNFRAALVSFGPDGPAVEGFRSASMPGIAGEIGRDAFFDALAAPVSDLASRARRIGFCFSYPTEILPDHEGRLVYFTKEIRAPEVEGTLVGAGLRDALARAGVRGKLVTVILNDTTATLLAGRLAADDPRQFDGYVGYILGTGTNAAYQEVSIPKAPGAAEQIVVLESGGFAIRGRGDLDEAFDRTTKDPRRYPCEKMHSGAYLGGLALTVLRAAAREGLFSAPAAAALEKVDTLAAKEVSAFLRRPFDASRPLGAAAADSDRDRERVYLLLDALVSRAAMLAAGVLAAVVLKSGRGVLASRPVCAAVDGTTWREVPGLAGRAEAILDRHLAAERGRHVRIVLPERAPLMGAAVAALAG